MVVQLTNGNSSYFERTETVSKYLSDIRHFQILSKEEETELFKVLRNGEVRDEKGKIISRTPVAEKARNAIANSNQRLVLSVARHYSPSEKILDCVSEGTCGLMEAIDRYDITKDVKFITYAIHYIRRNITQYLRDEDPSIRQTNTSKTYHCIARAYNSFVQKEEREPSPEELVEILNTEYKCDIKDVNDVIDMRIISIDESVDDDEESVGETQLFNSYCSNDNDYEEQAQGDYAKEFSKTLFSILSPREIQIISMSFGVNGYHKEYEAKEIAKELSLTPERVRQIKKMVIDRLREEALSRMKKI